METLYEVCAILIDTETCNIIIRGSDGLESYIPFDPLKYPNGVTVDDIYRGLYL